MKNTLKLGTVLLALVGSGVVFAANHAGGHGNDHGKDHGMKHTHEHSHEHKHGDAKDAKKPMAAADMADGEIRKINKSTGKITVKHGEIKSVEMPPMTMVFGVSDKAMLEGLKEGDKVKFNVKQDGSNYTVTEIKKAE